MSQLSLCVCIPESPWWSARHWTSQACYHEAADAQKVVVLSPYVQAIPPCMCYKKRYLQSEFFLYIYFLFPSRWTFNPAVLKKLSVGEAPPRLSLVMPEDPFMFQPGHFVKVNSDQDAVKQQQAGHGDWVPAMEMVRRGDVNGKDYQPIPALTHSSVSWVDTNKNLAFPSGRRF